MADTVFLLGAGINRSARSWHDLVAPISGDFFRHALRHPRISAQFMQDRLAPLFAFTRKFWRMDRDDLLEKDFDLEDCFTLVELERREAFARGDQGRLEAATYIQDLLTELLLEYLGDLHYGIQDESAFGAFAAHIYDTKSVVLTLNYDTLLESQIENASPPNTSAIQTYMRRQEAESSARSKLALELRQQGASEEAIAARMFQEEEVTDDDVAFTHHVWNPVLAYAARFDEVTLATPGISKIVSGSRYYGHPRNAVDHAPFLKLHGSLGWFVRSGYFIDGRRLPDEMPSKTIVGRGFSVRRAPIIDHRSGEYLRPLLLTPQLLKPYHDLPLLDDVWRRAYHELSVCRRLVVGGYSFPSADRHVRFLLRRALAEREIEELCVVDPNEAVVQTTKEVCHFRGRVQHFRDLESLMGT